MPPADAAERIQLQEDIVLPAGYGLGIYNPFGDIHVRQGEAGPIRLTVFTQRTRRSEVNARISREPIDGFLQLNISATPGAIPTEVLRIDAVVWVPSEPSLRLRTEHGMIEVKKLGNPQIEASSFDGELLLTASSVMHAYSEQGKIRATLMHPGWAGECRFISGSGQVQAFFPLSPNLHLSARAGISISSEFELDIQHNARGNSAEFLSGNGSDAIVVESRAGEVQLYSVVFDPKVYGAGAAENVNESALSSQQNDKK